MRFVIKHEIKGRIRIHLVQKRMTLQQADIPAVLSGDTGKYRNCQDSGENLRCNYLLSWKQECYP